ncbi:MAG: hypothetical protein KME30_28170 [Iphinoe sp. HA4291-MV1]|nr:hypothetical protein [Iphinoe sp. HA4291-MV1]
MKLFQIALVILVLLMSLVVAFPSWANRTPYSSNISDYFEIGQRVIWFYKARADSSNVQRIPAEVVKLGSKQVQVRVRKQNNGFVNRWVNRDRLEDDRSNNSF